MANSLFTSGFAGFDTSRFAGWSTPYKVVLSILIGAIILLGAYLLFYRPKLQMLTDAQHRESVLKQEIVDKQKISSNLPAYQVQMVEIKDRFAAALEQLPDSSEVPVLLTEISHAGRENGLEFKHFQPLNPVQDAFYTKLPIAIEAAGSYHQLAEFMSSIANLERIVTVGDFQIARASPTASSNEGGLDFKANIYTYYFRKNENKAEFYRGRKAAPAHNSEQ